MNIVIITPSLNGHYPIYIDLIKSGSDKSMVHIFSSSELFKVFFFCLKNKISNVFFLHGDSGFIFSFFLKCFFPSLNISLIIYYSFEEHFKGLKYSIKKILLKSLTFINIKLLLLEADITKIKHIRRNNIKHIYDPLILSNMSIKEKLNSKTEVHYLVAGFIDERKSIRLLFKVLIDLCNIDSKKRIITLLGVQTNSIINFISKLDLPKNIQIIQMNYRFNNYELEEELHKCDLMWAVYQNHHGSSGMVIHAIQYNKPVIFIPKGTLKRFSLELNIDILPKDLSEEEIKRCLYKLEIEKQFSSESRINFIKKRSQQQFVKILLND